MCYECVFVQYFVIGLVEYLFIKAFLYMLLNADTANHLTKWLRVCQLVLLFHIQIGMFN